MADRTSPDAPQGHPVLSGTPWIQSNANHPLRLSCARFFQIVADELFQKGFVDQSENLILQRLSRFLRLEPSVALAVARAAQQKARPGGGGPIGSMEPVLLYERIVTKVLAYGPAGSRENQMLKAIRLLTAIPDSLHDALIERRRSKGGSGPRCPEVPDRRAKRSSGVQGVQGVGAVSPSRDSLPSCIVFLNRAVWLAKRGNLEEAEQAFRSAVTERPRPDQFLELYRTALITCLDSAIGLDDPDTTLKIIEMAQRLAEISSEQVFRWASVGELLHRSVGFLVEKERLDDYARLLAQFGQTGKDFSEQLAPIRARNLVTSIALGLRHGHLEHVFAWHQALEELGTFLTNEAVAAELAIALSATIQALEGRELADPARYERIKSSFRFLVRERSAIRKVAKAFADCLEPWAHGAMMKNNRSEFSPLISEVQAIVRKFPGDEEIGGIFARSLVKLAISWMQHKETERQSQGFFARLFGRGSQKVDNTLHEIRLAMQVVVLSCPYSDRIADARRRFEGLTGFTLAITADGRTSASLPRIVKANAA